MSVAIVSFEVTGISPLLMNNPASMARPAAGIGRKEIPSPEVESESKVYRDDDGNLYIPTPAVRAALLASCAGRRLGKVGAKTVIQGAVFCVAPTAALYDPDTRKPIKSYKINIARAVVQHNSVHRARPEIPKWAFSLDLEIDNDFIKDPGIIEELLNIAGRINGLLDWRPQKRGPYGRFRAKIVDNTVAKRNGRVRDMATA